MDAHANIGALQGNLGMRLSGRKFKVMLALLLLPMVVLCQTPPLRYKPTTNVTEADTNKNYSGTVNSTIQNIYFYEINSTVIDFSNATVRLRVEADKDTSKPLSSLSVAIIKPGDISTSIRLPKLSNRNGTIIHLTDAEMYTAERTICLLNPPNENYVAFSVVVSTRSDINIKFNLSVDVSSDFILNVEETRHVIVSPNTPVFYHFIFDERMDSVVVMVDANNTYNRCMTLSVQIPICPIFDQEDNIHYGGVYQTITSSGSLLVQKQKPFDKGFVVVIIAHLENEECQKRDPFSLPFSNLFNEIPSNFSIPINITVSNREKNQESRKAFYWSLPILISIGISLILFVVLCIRHKCIRTDEFTQNARMNSWPGSKVRELSMNDFNHDKNKHQASFSWQVSVVTGDSDLCYYNYRCAHPFWIFLDFNHIVSNIPYVIFGIMILVFSKYHKLKLEKLSNSARPACATEQQNLVENEELPQNVEGDPHNGGQNQHHNAPAHPEFGVPFHYDMFNALGVSLIVEGILSASYHLCPNEATFQFDTCFMYVIALMTIIHLYQLRHPSCFSEKHALLTLIFIVIPTVFSIVSSFLSHYLTSALMYFFVVSTLVVCILVGINYGFLGEQQDSDSTYAPVRIFTFPNINQHKNMNRNNIYPLRFLLPFGCLVISSLVQTYWLMFRCPLSTYMLYLLVGNMCWNLIYYILMKFIHGELTWKGIVFPAVYLTLAVVFGGCAVNFYFKAAAKWELPPSASRAVNKECLKVLGIEYPFDFHDVWHILSAAAIFCTFNVSY
ncbi:unnamed protein product [Orchesella dallaii]|uniref:SID1 transmembrane family member 1 n=1 Tax=Orchesella dallaii TaxID=48710 RepID=A0ABP1RQT1_9HEXA